MTHDERVWHHEMETCEGIHEHAERIAKLEELVQDMEQEIGRLWSIMSTCIRQRRCPNAYEMLEADLTHGQFIERMYGLDIEVKSRTPYCLCKCMTEEEHDELARLALDQCEYGLCSDECAIFATGECPAANTEEDQC